MATPVALWRIQMPLGAPTITSVISECSLVIPVAGQLTNNRVRVYRGNEVICDEIATATQAPLPLLPGKTLKAKDHLAATQADNTTNEESPRSLIVTVQGKPQNLGSVVFTSPIYECAKAIGVGGVLVEAYLYDANTNAVVS